MTRPTFGSIAVVGGSTAGVAAAGELRRRGFAGRLVIVGAEDHAPYDRPPLIKQFLSGQWDESRIGLPGADDPMLEADWRRGVAATGLDVAARSLDLSDGSRLQVDGIVLACGSTPRRLPGSEGIGGVQVLRSLDDARRLRAAVAAPADRVVVIGAGFIGCEIAATCAQVGVPVSLVDPLPTPMHGVVGPTIGEVFTGLHHDHGVDLHLGVGVDGFDTDPRGRLRAVRLADGTSISASIAVMGVGVTPNTAWLEGSGLTLDDGIVCDVTSTAAPGITAAGDVARWPNPVFDGASMRIEHWDHAMGHGEQAAIALLAGSDAPEFATVPWFWTDQFDRKLQLAGRIRPDDEMLLVDGSLDERRFVALFARAGRLVGVMGMNRPGPVMRLRARIAERIGIDDAVTSFG